jgi:hypothetical protein
VKIYGLWRYFHILQGAANSEVWLCSWIICVLGNSSLFIESSWKKMLLRNRSLEGTPCLCLADACVAWEYYSYFSVLWRSSVWQGEHSLEWQIMSWAMITVVLHLCILVLGLSSDLVLDCKMKD